jgi:hypothetical protein
MKWLSPEPTPKGKRVIGRVLEVGAPVLIPDVAANPDYVEGQRSTRSAKASPIVGSGGHPIGVFIRNPMERTPITVVLDVVTLFYVEVEVKVGLTHS